MVLGIGTTFAVRRMKGGRAADQRKGLRWLRQHKAQSGPKGRQLLAQDSACILRVVQLLNSSRSDVRSEAAACLTELTCHSESQVCWVVVDTPGLLQGLGEVLLSTRCAARCDKDVVAAVATSIGFMASSSIRACNSMVAVADLLDGLAVVLGHPYLPLDDHMVHYWAAHALEALAAEPAACKCILEAPGMMNAVGAFTQRVSGLQAGSAAVHLAQEQAGQLVRVLASEPGAKEQLQQMPDLVACLQQLTGSAFDSVKIAAAAALEELGPSRVPPMGPEPAYALSDEGCDGPLTASSSDAYHSMAELEVLTAEDLQPVEAALERWTTAASEALKAAGQEAQWGAAAAWGGMPEKGCVVEAAMPTSKAPAAPLVHLWVRTGGLSALPSTADSDSGWSG